jgi:ubiquinone/menaquinone biosynthesis C-methylase UbiE
MSGENLDSEVLKSGPKEDHEYVILEIGGGKYPLPFDAPDSYREWMQKNPNARYISADINLENLQKGRASQQGKDQERGIPVTERVGYIQAAGTELPIADASISELVLKNVLGDPSIWSAVKLLMLHEANRVIRPGGLFKVIEQESPDFARQEDLRRFILDMRKRLFVLESEFARPLHERDFDAHMHQSSSAAPSSFILRLRKKISVTGS